MGEEGGDIEVGVNGIWGVGLGGVVGGVGVVVWIEVRLLVWGYLMVWFWDERKVYSMGCWGVWGGYCWVGWDYLEGGGGGG
uniref:Transmembrane protein n=1 Tax=Knipowitschia caucasica TaxID=637954 RepID=A0AAV2M768_KNICA